MSCVHRNHQLFPCFSCCMIQDASVLLPDRLVKFLSSFDHAEPLLLGSRLISGKTVFVSSAGFALSRGALERLRPQGLVEVKSVPRGSRRWHRHVVQDA